MGLELAPYLPPQFWVVSAAGSIVGYGSEAIEGVFEIYLPGGDEEGWMGAVEGNLIEFSNGEPAGNVDDQRVLDDEGTLVAIIHGNEILGPDGKLIATTTGDAPAPARGGAALLLKMLIRSAKLD